MDIFKRIYKEERQNDTSQTCQFVEQNGRYKIANPPLKDALCEPKYYAYTPPTGKPYLEKSKKAEKRALKFYKFLTKKRPIFYSDFFSNLQKKRIDRFIDKMLKKGINFEYFDNQMHGKLLYEIGNIEKIRLLYNHGFDVTKALKSRFSNHNFQIGAWSCVKDVNYIEMLDAPIFVLEKIINTRKDVVFSTDVIDQYIDKNCRYTYGIEKIEVLIKYGQAELTPKQIENLAKAAKGCYDYQNKFPYLLELCDYMVKVGEIDYEDITPKYTTQKQLTGTNEAKKSEIEEQIDNIFEAAQNSIE